MPLPTNLTNHKALEIYYDAIAIYQTQDKDKTQLKVNESLTLTGIPAECFEYRLGNRSALDWVIDQYQVSTDKRSGITSDPNRDDDEEYIVRLVGRVITVSMETVKLVKALPSVVEVTAVQTTN